MDLIFTGVTKAAEKGESVFYLSQVDKVVAALSGPGDIMVQRLQLQVNPQMLDRWLYTRDLRHAFTAGRTGMSIEW